LSITLPCPLGFVRNFDYATKIWLHCLVFETLRLVRDSNFVTKHNEDSSEICELVHCWILTPVAGLFIEAEHQNIFLERFSEKNFKKSALLVLWSGFINPPLQSLVNQCFSQISEQLFSKKIHEKYSPHSNLGIFLRLFEPIWVSPIWQEYLNYSNITSKIKILLKILSVLKIFSKPRTHKNSLATGVTAPDTICQILIMLWMPVFVFLILVFVLPVPISTISILYEIGTGQRFFFENHGDLNAQRVGKINMIWDEVGSGRP